MVEGRVGIRQKLFVYPVLRIHLILMQILDPYPGHFFKIYRIFLTKNNFQIFCFIFFAYFFADPDSESQNLADPTDPDPKH